MQRPTFIAPVVCLCAATVCSAQSMNIDFAGEAKPDGTYRAAGAAGTWNLVVSGVEQPPVYVDIHDNVVPVTLTIDPIGTPIEFTTNPDVIDQNDDRLLNDYLATIGWGSDDINIDFTGLQDGTYDVVVYAWYPQTVSPSDHLSLVGVYGNEVFFGSSAVGGVWPGDLFPTVTHLTKRTVVEGGELTVNVHGPCLNCSGAKINGIQLIFDPLFADLDRDHDVDVDDLVMLILNFGPCPNPPLAPPAPTPCESDLTGDFVVTIDDVIELILAWTGDGGG